MVRVWTRRANTPPRTASIARHPAPELIAPLCLAALVALACAAQAADPPHVTNPATPAEGVETLHLQELWRAGGEDDDAIFGLISQALVGDDGTVYLLDTQLSEVQVYAPEGEFLKTLSREGEGPGETRTPTDMLFLPDGTLGLVQAFPGKIVRIDLEGTPAGDLTPDLGDATEGGFLSIRDARCEGGNLVIAGQRITVNQTELYREDQYFLSSFGLDGTETHRFRENTERIMFNNIVVSEQGQGFIFRRWAVGPRGQVAVPADWDGYVIDVYAADGSLERVIERAYEPYVRGEKEKARADAVIEAIRGRQGIELEFIGEENEPSVGTMHFTDEGDLWVLPSQGTRNQPDGCMATYDVFDPAGRFKKQVRVMCEGDGVIDGLIFAGKDRVLQVVGLLDAVLALQGAQLDEEDEEPAPMEVVCYARQ